MRKVLLPFVAIVLFSCNKEEAINSVVIQNPDVSSTEFTQIDIEDAVTDIKMLTQQNIARLDKMTMTRSACKRIIKVPRDYSTIQEAVDNVCENGIIIVNAGTYTEVVLVYKPGIKMKAKGNVTLVGGFLLNGDADGVTIQNFKIILGEENRRGILSFNVTGGKFMHNTITAAGNDIGMFLINSSQLKVYRNHISNMEWGISVATSSAEGSSCNHNTISNNYITENTLASGIQLQGNCDNNLLNGNTVVDNAGVGNAGITLFSNAPPGAYCDNNIVKNNVSSGNATGCLVFFDGTNNQIGPNNQFVENRLYGFYINGSASGNHIFSNTIQNNTPCDIGNFAIDPNANTFSNNAFDCIDIANL
jgi:parallel beta-helix repeat protein